MKSKPKGAYDDEPEQPRDTGRKGYREPEEVPDGRPTISYRPFWTDLSEQLTYEHAVETHPKRPDESPMAYIQRIAAIVEGRLAAVKAVPKASMTRKQFQQRLAELEKQREPR